MRYLYMTAMAPSKKLARDAIRYERLNDQYHESESSHLPTGSSFTDAGHPSSQFNTASRSGVRRRRPEPNPISVMSLVGLKNLFFRQTITPVPVRTKSSRDIGMLSISLPQCFPSLGLAECVFTWAVSIIQSFRPIANSATCYRRTTNCFN
jgi:hypothetical protein